MLVLGLIWGAFEDAQEEFLVLVPRGSQLYSRTGAEWAYADTLGNLTAGANWEAALAAIPAGRFTPETVLTMAPE